MRQLSGIGIRHTAHGGQLARSVGSPVTFVALTAIVDKAISKKVDVEGIVLGKGEYGQCNEVLLAQGCCYKSTAVIKIALFGRTFATTYAFRSPIPLSYTQ